MARRKIYLVSPREPSGATWLINCLLELGIRTYRSSPQGMWRRDGGEWLLNAHEDLLKKWLPVLGDRDRFRFREDIEVQWTHQWFTAPFIDAEILYFIRDPRDALYSRYRREAPEQTYAEFIAFPDVYTLLDKATNWRLFTATWLTHPRVQAFRFEDYKTDARSTLAAVLDSLRLAYSDADIDRAVQSSAFERAAAAERAYRAAHPEDTQIINRSGRPMEWQTGEIDSGVVETIERRVGKLLDRFSYQRRTSSPGGASLTQHVSSLAFLRAVQGIAQVAAEDWEADAPLSALAAATSVDKGRIARARLPDYELQQLRNSTREYLQSIVGWANRALDHAIPGPRKSERIRAAVRRVRAGLSRAMRRLFTQEA